MLGRTPQLHFVMAEVVVVKAFEPAAELIGCGAIGGTGGVEPGALHDLLGDVDWAVGTEGQGDGIGRAGVDYDGLIGLAEP